MIRHLKAFLLSGVVACSMPNTPITPPDLTFPISCAKGWFALSLEGDHLFAVELGPLSSNDYVRDLPVHVIADFATSTRRLETLSPQHYFNALKLSPFEDGILSGRDGIIFNDGSKGILRAIQVAGDGLETVQIHDSADLPDPASDSETLNHASLSFYQPMKSAGYFIAGSRSKRQFFFLNLSDLQVKTAPLGTNKDAMLLLTPDGQIRLRYTRSLEPLSDHVVVFTDGTIWDPPEMIGRKKKLTKFLFHIAKSHVPDDLQPGDYILNGQFDHRFDRIKGSRTFDGVDHLISIDRRKLIAPGFDMLGYSYQTETAYWVSETAETGETRARTSLDWLQEDLDQIFTANGQFLHLVSAAENDGHTYLIVGYEIEGRLRLELLSDAYSSPALLCDPSPAGTPRTSLILEF